jgi:hypothetical protein
MPVPPDELIYGNGHLEPVGACARCGSFDEFCFECEPELERQAATLWRQENPDMSVFCCDREMKNRYRRRATLDKDAEK